jgi:hydroxypyruvate isomerase
MHRRSFLATTMSAAAFGAQSNPAPPKKAPVTSSVMLWTLKGSFEEKLLMAAKAGLQSVELVGEHTQWTDAETARMKKAAASFGLGMDTVAAAPDWKNRPVTMVDPAHRQGFLSEVQKAIVWAQKLEVPQIILLTGDDIPGRTHQEQYASVLEGAQRAGELAAKAGVTLIIEPLNAKVNHKGFFLTNCVEGLKLVKEADNPHVRLLFDIYHEQVQMGNVTRTIIEAAPYTGVFHVADNPGRNDPGTGEIHWPNVYKAIQKTGYSGYITMEYIPLGDPVASLIKAVDGMRDGIKG